MLENSSVLSLPADMMRGGGGGGGVGSEEDTEGEDG